LSDVLAEVPAVRDAERLVRRGGFEQIRGISARQVGGAAGWAPDDWGRGGIKSGK
jgi:hypothetical protein